MGVQTINFEPQKFLYRPDRFFLHPAAGALLTFFVKDDVEARLRGAAYYQLVGTEGGIVFLFSSYRSGHFIFLIGSWLLDDWYDGIRNATDVRKIEELVGMPQKTIGAPLWVSDDRKRCPKCRGEINWLDIVGSALDQVHPREMIARVI